MQDAGAQHERNIDAAERFVALCQQIDDASDDADFWTYLSQKVAVDHTFDVAITRTWCLQSGALLNFATIKGDPELIPLAPSDPSGPSANEVMVTSLHQSRTVEPVPYHSVLDLSGDTSEPWTRWLAVPMSKSEYTSSPVVRLTSRIQGEQQLSLSFGWRQLLPVSTVEVAFGPDTPVTSLSLEFPEHATVSVVAFRCAVDWSPYLKDLDELLNGFKAKVGDGQTMAASPAAANTRRMSDLQIFTEYVDDEVVAKIQGRLSAIKEFVEESAKRELSPRSFRKTKEIWLGGLELAGNAVDQWRKDWSKNSTQQSQNGTGPIVDAINAAESLRNTLANSATFVLPVEVQRDGSIDQSALSGALRSHQQATSVSSLVIPFTTETEPSTQGKRSSLILLLLAVVMLVTSLMDFSWLARVEFLSGLLNVEALPAANAEMESALRGPLATLLLIFPAALYGQFFQSRPVSAAGHRAQAGTFGALSILFALPIFPAAVVAVGGSLAFAAALSFLFGLFALGASVAVWFIFSRHSLSRIRKSDMIKHLQDVTKDRQPPGKA